MQNNTENKNVAGQINAAKSKIETNKKSKIWPLFALLILPFILLTSEVGFGMHYAISTETPVLPSYFERGQHPDEELSYVHQAEKLGMKAKLDMSGKIEVTLDKPIADKDLVLKLRHPTISNLDVTINLKQLPNNPLAYVANKPNLTDVTHWYVALGPKDGNWRVSGILEEDDTQIELTP